MIKCIGTVEVLQQMVCSVGFKQEDGFLNIRWKELLNFLCMQPDESP